MKRKFYYTSHRSACETVYRNLDIIIKEQDLQQKKVYMFGFSRIICMIIGYLQKEGVSICGIVDNSKEKQGKELNGLITYSPDILKDYDENIVVMIASSFQDEMIAQLENMGYHKGKNIIKVVDMPKLMSDYSFVDREGYKKMPNAEVRKRMVKLMVFLKEICEKNNIHYYLGYGTLLGAVRHKGFIPWDDDVDVLVNGDDIDQLAELVNQSDEYEMITCRNCDYYFDNMAIITEKNSVVDLNIFPYQATLGVMIDVFPLYGVPENINELKEQTAKLKSMELDKLNAFYDMRKCHELTIKLDDEMRKKCFCKSEYIGFLIGPYLTADWHKRDEFEDEKMLAFEGEKFAVPGNYDAVLTRIYGDYMQLPPENKRKSTHYYNAYYKKAE